MGAAVEMDKVDATVVGVVLNTFEDEGVDTAPKPPPKPLAPLLPNPPPNPLPKPPPKPPPNVGLMLDVAAANGLVFAYAENPPPNKIYS